MTVDQKIQVVKDFILYCKDNLGIENLPKLEFIKDRDWVISMRSFGEYDYRKRTLKVYITNRNLADILRTLSHELVHHKQNEDGRLYPNSGETGSDIENEANSISGVLMRNYGKQNEIIYESKLVSVVKEIKNSRFKIFCDMDGVLCNFDSQFEHYYGVSPKEYSQQKGAQIFKNAVDDVGIDFWAKMPWFPGGEELWAYISQYSPMILSSPSTFKFAAKGKLQWIKDNLNPQPSQIIFEQTRNKHSIFEKNPSLNPKNCILIDDYYTNILPWKEVGGIGLLHKDAQKTISILNKFGL
jgi:hypothetical protein